MLITCHPERSEGPHKILVPQPRSPQPFGVLTLTSVSVWVLLASLLLAAPLRAAEAPAGNGNGELSQAELLKRMIELTDEVSRLRREVEQLKQSRPAAAPAPQAEVDRPRPSVPVVAEKPEEDDEVARIERQRAIESVSRSGVLLGQNKFEVEPSVNYTHASSNLISIDGFSILPILVIGDIQSLRVERDTVTSALSARYGILNDLQIDVSVPYKFQRDRYVTQTQTDPSTSARNETTIEDHGLGDVSFGVSYQAFYEQGNLPDVILSARATAPSGDSIFDLPVTNPGTNQFTESDLPLGNGVWSLRGGVTAIKSLDPVVLIFNAGYTHSFERDLKLTSISDTGGGPVTNTVKTVYQPGDTVDFGVAVAIAMNPVFAVNLQIQQRITFDTELDGLGDVEGSSTNEADLRFGFAWALTHNMVFNFSAAAGLTEDTPDLALSFSLPIKF